MHIDLKNRMSLSSTEQERNEFAISYHDNGKEVKRFNDGLIFLANSKVRLYR